MKFRKIKYHIKYYIFLFLYFFLAYGFVFITFGAYNSQIEGKIDFFSYLKDDCIYGQNFDYDRYYEDHTTLDGVLYNMEYTNEYTIYYYSGDYKKYGIPYSIKQILTVTKTKEISPDGITVNYEMYKANGFKNTIMINNQSYNIKNVIYIKYPKKILLYENEKIEKFNFVLIKDDTIKDSDFGIIEDSAIKDIDPEIIDEYGVNIRYFHDWIIGCETKKSSDDTIKIYVTILNISIIVPILFILISIIFIYDYISKKYIKDLNNKIILGATKKNIFNSLFFELISVSFIGLILSYFISYIICLIINMKLTITIMLWISIYNILLSYLFAKRKSNKLYKKYLGGKKC